MIPVETVPGIWGGVDKDSIGGSEFMQCKNLCKCHYVCLPSTTIKRKNKGKKIK
jgi:hypothetical protein